MKLIDSFSFSNLDCSTYFGVSLAIGQKINLLNLLQFTVAYILFVFKMMHLIEQKLEILVMIGCGDKARIQKDLCEMFNNKFPDRPVSQCTVLKIYSKKIETCFSVLSSFI